MSLEEKQFGSVWFVPGKNLGRYPFCHSVYIESAGVLIDPGSDRKRLIQLRKDCDVNEVWLSHWHEDHLMHLDLFDDLPLLMSEPDAPAVSDLEVFLDSYGMDDENEREEWRGILTKTFNFRPRKPKRFLKGGERIHLDSVTVDVISTPGHTPGHLSFFFKEPGVLFIGDYDLTPFGPWYGDVDSSIDQTIESVQLLRDMPANVWLTSHETGLFEEEPGILWEQYLGVITQREEKLLDLLTEPHPFEDIVGACIIYGRPREPKSFFEFGERAQMKKHLADLIKRDIVAMNGEKYYRK